MMTSSSGIILHVTVSVEPDKIDEFLKHLRPAYEACIAEPECTFFEVSISQDEPGVLKFVEGWTEGREWFEKHQLTKPYYKPYFDATKKLWTKPAVLEYYDRVPGMAYAMPAHFS